MLGLMDGIEAELAKITTFHDETAPIKAKEVPLGEMTDRDLRLNTLARDYIRRGKQMRATKIMLEEEDSEEGYALEAQRVFYEQMAELLRDIMWLEMRARHLERLKTMKSTGLGLRTGRMIVAMLTPAPPRITDILGGFL
jgi:hypothetical protein